MKSVLVTGSNGQLGKSIQKVYKKSAKFDFTFTTSKELDITNPELIQDFFKNSNFDYCINCAAYTNVEQAEKEPEKAFEVNAEGVRNLANVCKEKNIILIHISTDYVFDGEQIEPYAVNDVPNPINEYGKSKLKGEEYIQEILTAFFIIRTSWLYNKEFGKNFYKTIIEKAETEEVLYITDVQKGCPTNTENLALFILKLIVSNDTNFGIFHFTDHEVMTWYDFAKRILIENKMINKVKLEKVKNYRTFAARPKNSTLASETNILNNEN
ncbi:dTDP-4-dehydrorhamnose reductase [Flavobacteriaceae bacterium R38]|nr:dTDP-4-dehydrorhamnose reductase [Flavobacteriaceae bacterium R38]